MTGGLAVSVIVDPDTKGVLMAERHGGQAASKNASRLVPGINVRGAARQAKLAVVRQEELSHYGLESETAPDPACNADPLVLSCFRAYIVSLEPWHAQQLDRITIEIVSRALGGRRVTNVPVSGHAADLRERRQIWSRQGPRQVGRSWAAQLA
jgi:hypothetical protein